MSRLIVMAGLPGTGKSSLARELARATGAFWLRIDSIEQAIHESGVAKGSLDDSGYRVAYALAEDNLKLGREVIGDSVNPWMLTRDAWRDAGLRADAQVIEIEVLCSDAREHRRRIETRSLDVPGLIGPTWASVVGRDYRPWDRQPLRIDTAGRSLAACVAQARAAIESATRP